MERHWRSWCRFRRDWSILILWRFADDSWFHWRGKHFSLQVAEAFFSSMTMTNLNFESDSGSWATRSLLWSLDLLVPTGSPLLPRSSHSTTHGVHMRLIRRILRPACRTQIFTHHSPSSSLPWASCASCISSQVFEPTLPSSSSSLLWSLHLDHSLEHTSKLPMETLRWQGSFKKPVAHSYL
jgi:hypothetical protein